MPQYFFLSFQNSNTVCVNKYLKSLLEVINNGQISMVSILQIFS